MAPAPPCRTMLLRDLPMTVSRELEMQLNMDERWIQLVDNIPKNFDSLDFVPKYTALKRSAFERIATKPRGNPTRSVLDDWSTMLPKLDHLITALLRANLISSAKYLVEDFLGEEPQPPAPPQIPPTLPHLDLPPVSINIVPSQYCGRVPPLEGAVGYINVLHVKNTSHFYDKMSDISDNLNDDSHDQKAEMYGSLHYQEGQFSSMPAHDLQAAPSLNQEHFNSDDNFEHDNMETNSEEKFKGVNKKMEIDKLLERDPVISYEVKDNPEFIHHVKYQDLIHITANFNNEKFTAGGRVLGKGGFGTVYLGIDHDGKRVAIKKTNLQHETSDEKSEASFRQFQTELNTLSQHRHVNILPLLAYSCDTANLCIVYEYMASGSLLDRLQCKDGSPSLPPFLRLNIASGTAHPLSQLAMTHILDGSPSLPPFLRLDIASGTAHGIHYLNSHGMVHRDIKTANILLNETFTPKLGDFATTRLGPSGASMTVLETMTVIGTPTYLAPEAHMFDISSKLDSFGFGMVLLEILTGLPAFDIKRENKDLRSHVEENCDDLPSILDQSASPWEIPVAEGILDIAWRCLHLTKKKRATVSEILEELDAI